MIRCGFRSSPQSTIGDNIVHGDSLVFPDSGLRLNFKTDRTDAASSLLIAGLEFPVNIGFRLMIGSKRTITKEAHYNDYSQKKIH